MLIVACVLILCYLVADKPLVEFIPSDPARFGLYLLAALGLAGWYAQRTFRRWNRPTAEELYNRRPTHFQNTSHPDATQVTERKNPFERLAERDQQRLKEEVGETPVVEAV